MFGRSLSVLALLGFCVGFLPDALAQAGSSPRDGALGRREVHAWLLRIHDATRHRNFQGTFVVSAGGSIASARIAHYCDGRNQFERIDTMDGQMQSVFRYNDVVHTFWPRDRVALVEQRELMTSFPALLQGDEDRIADSYEVHRQGASRVAGHETDVLQLKPRDAYRFGYRLWSEKSSGLLLRAEVLGERDEVLEASAFSEVVIGVKPQAAALLQRMNRLDGYRVLRPTLKRTQLDSEGWRLAPPVSGFRLVSSVKRPLNVTVDSNPAAAPEVLQSIYSDGLTYLSVFIESFDPQRHARPMQTSIGATQSLMLRQGDAWVTVIGDAPAATLSLFANALERKK